MASSSKRLEPETPEEMEARKRIITGGTTKGGHRGQYNGNEIMMNRDGSNGFSFGSVASDPSSKFKWNEKTGDYRSHGGGIMSVAEMPVTAAAPDAAPIGAPAPEKKDWRDNIDMTQGEGSAGSGEGLTTDQIVDNTGMDNWMAMGPQTAGQHINPLVDPNNWQYQVDPANQRVRNLGTYQNPMLDEWMDSPFSQGGLLALNTGGLLNG
jgi:hypothetical protein